MNWLHRLPPGLHRGSGSARCVWWKSLLSRLLLMPGLKHYDRYEACVHSMSSTPFAVGVESSRPMKWIDAVSSRRQPRDHRQRGHHQLACHLVLSLDQSKLFGLLSCW
mmetsp:Transcript_16376/g.49181  ORF Transcript_16376/g.49181 Transcript_16376/m.49181 type:complete len:108 (+) Transcript_16376:215-538(+)